MYWFRGDLFNRFLKLKNLDDSKTLYFFPVIFKHQDRILLWVYHNQSRTATKKYEYTISILSGNKMKDMNETFRLVKYAGFCLPLEVKVHAMKENQLCLTIPKKTADDARDSESKLWIEVTIAKTAAKNNMLN